MIFQKGQLSITIGSVLAGVSFVAAPIITYYTGQAAVQEDIATVDAKISAQSERTAKIETLVPIVLDGQEDMKEDLELIKKALWIKEETK